MPDRSGLLGLGSNVGDRRGHLQAAVDALAAEGLEVLESSSVYDTDPVGEVLDQPSFLNACVRIRTELEPFDLLDLVKDIEAAQGRPAGGPRHRPRTIDIDLLLLGEVELLDDRLSLPHRDLLARRFVLIPALELDLEMALPDRRSLADALAALPVDEGVRWAGPPLEIRAARPTV